MKFFILLLSIIFLFSCASKNKDSSEAPIKVYIVSSERLNNIDETKFSKESLYLPCKKDSEDFYPVYEACWNYGFKHKNCEEVVDSNDLDKIFPKTLNTKDEALNLATKIFACAMICSESVKKKQPVLSYEDYLKNCPIQMKAIKDLSGIHIYITTEE